MLSIPQPCNESWAAMTPTASGRHCAACQKNVVDFTLKTDAEILAYLARAASGSTCGRFAAGQLERPLQRAVPAAPTRWRAWLAAAVAVWGVREGMASAVRAQAPVEQRQVFMGILPVGKTLPARVSLSPQHHLFGAVPVRTLTGVVLDSANHAGLPGVTVLVAGTTMGVSSDAAGQFTLEVPEAQWQAAGHTLVFSSVGYRNQFLRLPSSDSPASAIEIVLRPDHQALGGVVVMDGYDDSRKPWPWHPRRFYYWSKYWFTRPLRRG